jgi:hypothetical protein
LGTCVAATAAFPFRSIHHVQCLNNAPKMVNEFIPVQTFTTTPSRRITP